VAIGNGGVRKVAEDAIEIAGSGGVVPAELFDRVQRKIARRRGKPKASRGDYPLSGLLYCESCGQALHGHANTRPNRQGRKAYTYYSYECPTYNSRGRRNKSGCGHFVIGAAAVEAWLIPALQKVYLGPGRGELVEHLEKALRRQANSGRADVERLQGRLAELDREVARLVKAVRTVDAPELLTELVEAREERSRIKATLTQAGRCKAAENVQAEAERIAGFVWQLGESLSAAEPAVLRELFQRMVSRITCRWERGPEKNGRVPCKLVGGRVELRPLPEFSCLSSSQDYAEA
jgi:hypothetical protein